MRREGCQRGDDSCWSDTDSDSSSVVEREVATVVVEAAFTRASKVEAAYRRSDGLQGTLVVCFQKEEDALAARGWHNTAGGVVCAVGAYSMRMVSCEQRVVRAWWREGSHWRQQ